MDDEPSIAQGVAALLRKRGYTVLVALSGASALHLLREQPVDGIIIDFRIPDIRGDVLFAGAVALQPHLRHRTVFLTGDVSESVPQALRDTNSSLVLKPFDWAELQRLVDAMMRDDAGSDGWAADGSGG